MLQSSAFVKIKPLQKINEKSKSKHILALDYLLHVESMLLYFIWGHRHFNLITYSCNQESSRIINQQLINDDITSFVLMTSTAQTKGNSGWLELAINIPKTVNKNKMSCTLRTLNFDPLHLYSDFQETQNLPVSYFYTKIIVVR